MESPYLFAVRCWIHPDTSADLIAWLDGGHLAEVVSQPGFLSAKRYRLAQDADDGWHAHLMLYTVESKAALEAYFANPIREKFSRENAKFGEKVRTDRIWGALEYEHQKSK